MNTKQTLIKLDVEQKERAIELIASFFDCSRYETCFRDMDKEIKLRDFDSKNIKIDNGVLSFYDSMSFYVLTTLRLQFFDDTFQKKYTSEYGVKDHHIYLENEPEYFINIDEVIEMIEDFTINQLLLLGENINMAARIRFEKFLIENMNLVQGS